LPSRQTGLGFDTPSIHANLAVAQHAVNARLGHPFELPEQEVIHTLTVMVRANLDVLDLQWLIGEAQDGFLKKSDA
jgi:hypothetical protein